MEPRHTGRMIAFGLLGGAIGTVAGAFLGHEAFGGDDGYFKGAVLGEALLLPVGVHLGADPRGSLPTSTLASLAIGAVGTAMTVGLNNPLPLLIVPVVQLGTSISIERRTARP